MITETYSIPCHGTYLIDIITTIRSGLCGRCDYRPLLSLTSTSYTPTDEIISIILGMVRRAYPDATADSIINYHNKHFTVVGISTSMSEYVVISRQDNTWKVVALPINTYRDWVGANGPYAPIPHTLPLC